MRVSVFTRVAGTALLCVLLAVAHAESAVAAAPSAMAVQADPQDPFTAEGFAAPAVYGPRDGTVSLAVTLSELGVFDVDWKITDRTGSTIWDLGTATVDATQSQTATLEVPYEFLNGGLYYVRALFRRSPTVPGGYATQLFSSTSPGVPTFTVDESGPGTSLTAGTRNVFPAPDGFRDTTSFTLSSQTEPWFDVGLEVRNDDTNAVVHTAEFGDSTPRVGDDQPAGGDFVQLGNWNGRDADGGQVPAGYYTATATAHDRFGNPSRSRASLYVSSARLVTRTWTKTVPAASSRVSSTVGMCAALRSPATRRWAGSLSFNSGARKKCASRAATARVVSTTYKVTLPDAAPRVWLPLDPNEVVADPGRSLAVSVRAYGGAVATKKTRYSTAALRFIGASGRTGPTRQLAARLGWQPTLAGAVSGASSVIAGGPSTTPNGTGVSGPYPGVGRTLRWTTTTGGRAAYDVKLYVVAFKYTFLQN